MMIDNGVSRLQLFLMNKYQILQEIGQGQYGQVLKARNKQTSEIVAIKKFKDDENDQETKKVILRQVKVLKMMRHENITEFKEAFRKKGKVYLVCEFVEHNMLYLIEQSKAIEKQKIREYIYQILKALAYMHSLDLIHRDIKPENILINPDHSLKICDFGFTRVLPAASGDMTQYVATRWYRPPELLIGVSNYQQSVDIWAAGCLFGEMIDGDPLFPGDTQIDQLFLIQKMIGGLTRDHSEFFDNNPSFAGIQFTDICSDSLQRRYLNKMGKQGIDLMKKMLKMNPSQRITAAQALKHPYFQKLRPRATRSPNPSDIYDRSKQLTSSNHPPAQTREKPHISMLGINKIKGAIRQAQDGLSNPKYKPIINVQNIQTKQNNNSLPKNQKVLIQSRKQPRQKEPKKKSSTKQTYAHNYVQQFDDEQFPETSTSKPKQVVRKKKLQSYQDDPQEERVPPKTPVLGGRLKGKKKVSKYDDEYDGPNLVFQRRRDYQQNNNSCNGVSMVFNSNLHC